MKTFKLFIFLAFAIMTGLSSYAERLSIDEVESFVNNYGQSHNCTVLYTQTLYGHYNSDIGNWVAPVPRSALPVFEESGVDDDGYFVGHSYGIALIVRDPLEDEWYDHYDLGTEFYFDGNDLCDYEYETGVFQVIYDGPESDEEERQLSFIGSYFSTMRFLIYPDEVILIIYEENNNN
jgi:hypothetical protein